MKLGDFAVTPEQAARLTTAAIERRLADVELRRAEHDGLSRDHRANRPIKGRLTAAERAIEDVLTEIGLPVLPVVQGRSSF